MVKFYSKELDGLRGVAVLLVLFFHFGRLPNSSIGLEFGWIGVQLFFVLSGYLITRILMDQKKQSLLLYLKVFYWRRSLRIFPLYFAFLLTLSILYFLTQQPDGFPSIAGYLFTYTFNYSIIWEGLHVNRFFTHLWSLSVEEQFYIFWPFVVYFLSSKQLKVCIVSLLISGPILRYGLYLGLKDQLQEPETLGTAIYWFGISHLDAFAIGASVNFFPAKFLKIRPTVWLLVSSFLFAMVIFIMHKTHMINSITSLGFEIHAIDHLKFVWQNSLLNIFFAITLWVILVNGCYLLSLKPIVFIGQISYGIYVFHFPMMGIVNKVVAAYQVPILFELFVSFSTILLMAWCSYRLFEKRFLAMKDLVTSSSLKTP